VPGGAALEAIYARAIARAAAGEASLNASLAHAIEQELFAYAATLTRGIESLPTPRQVALRRAAALVQDAAAALDRALLAHVGTARTLAFRDTARILTAAECAAATTLGVPLAELGAVPVPRLADAHAFAAVAEVYDFRTLLRGHVVNAGREAVTIIRRGILAGERPDVLARALRPYVLGAERIPPALFQLGSVLDLRRVPVEYRGAARQLDYNAKRLAYSETHAARMLAQAVRMRDDPFVQGGQWHTAPDRGAGVLPDICDVLRDGDWYGMGAGVFPAGRIPPPPHPWDRCSVTVVPVRIAPGQDWRTAKRPPASYTLRVHPHRDTLPHVDEMTSSAAFRVRRDLGVLLGM